VRLEIADIFRLPGPDYREKYGERMLASHLKAMEDLERCRTEALGGQLYGCEHCGDSHYSYHSCLMESLFLWGVQRCCRRAAGATRRSYSPLRFGLEECNQFVGRAKQPAAEVWRNDGFNGLEFLGRIRARVHFSSCQVAMP
jgi:hypothetical protein